MPVDLQLLLSKILPLIVLPEGLLSFALLVVVFSVWRRAWRVASMSAALALGLFWTSATPAMANWLIGSLERQHPSDPATLPRVDVGIVLGGAVSASSPPRREPELGDAVDRVWHAAQLYRSGHIKRILVVGGNLPWSSDARPEAELIRTLLIDLGVAAAAIDIGVSQPQHLRERRRNQGTHAEAAVCVWIAHNVGVAHAARVRDLHKGRHPGCSRTV